jgi:hypothetical protein
MSDKNTGNGHKHTTETPDVSHIRNVEVTHEYSDISVGGVLTFMATLTVATIVISIGMWLLFDYFNAQAEKEAKPGPMALTKQERLPPDPRLQGAPGFALTLENGERVNLELHKPQDEYQVLRTQWEKTLREGAKDSSGNTIGMPIDEAIKRVVSAGLPARTTMATPGKLDDYAVSLPTAASSGRATEKRIQ